MDKILELKYQKFSSLESMSLSDRSLLDEAIASTSRSHAPYSNFRVGAAAKLKSGKIIYGANVESEVYPAGICAERNLLFAHSASDVDDDIVAIAIASVPDDRECYPCGLCRQTLLDVERRQGNPIRIIMGGGSSATVVESASVLVPFSFIL
ncbi:MAG: cytidine deaminase [Rikenellaceae bacterium]